MSIASQDIFDPMKAVLGTEAEPLLNDFLMAIQSASATLIGKLPSAEQGLASVATNTVLGIAGFLAQNEIAKLTTNVATTPGTAAAPVAQTVQPTAQTVEQPAAQEGPAPYEG